VVETPEVSVSVPEPSETVAPEPVAAPPVVVETPTGPPAIEMIKTERKQN
jgi:hypothetical protein